MINITDNTWQNNGVEVMVFNSMMWLNERHIEIQLNQANS